MFVGEALEQSDSGRDGCMAVTVCFVEDEDGEGLGGHFGRDARLCLVYMVSVYVRRGYKRIRLKRFCRINL